jgi:hypothetical protein
MVKNNIKLVLIIGIVLLSKNVASYNLYVGNMHSHTSYSDGVGTPAEAFEYARDNANIDFLAVTDTIILH